MPNEVLDNHLSIDEAINLNNQATHQTQMQILSQLNDLIAKGLLVITKEEPIITKNEKTNQLEISTKITIDLKDRIYIETLEKTNRELREILAKIRIS
jgi:hypothetical protein